MHLLVNDVSLATDDLLTQTLADRVRAVWEAHKSVDIARLNAVLTNDYTAVHPDGTVYSRKPTEQEIAAEEVDRYHLTQLRAVPIGPKSALVTYFAEVGIASHIAPATVKFVVGEVWIKKFRDWKCRYYQATVLKELI
jgi:Domain of unknown function (DUF4440)